VYREALAITRNTLGPRHPGVVLSLNNLAALLEDRGKLDEARQLLDESLDISRQAWGEGDAHVGSAYLQRADLEMAQDQPGAAVEDYREAMSIFGTTLPSNDPEAVFARAGVGQALLAMGDYEAAERLLLNGYNSFLADFGGDDEDVRAFSRHLADLYEAWGKPQLAAEYRAVSEGRKAAEPAAGRN